MAKRTPEARLTAAQRAERDSLIDALQDVVDAQQGALETLRQANRLQGQLLGDGISAQNHAAAVEAAKAFLKGQ